MSINKRNWDDIGQSFFSCSVRWSSYVRMTTRTRKKNTSHRKYVVKSRVLFISRDSLLLVYVSCWVAYSWGKIQKKCIGKRQRERERARRRSRRKAERKKQARAPARSRERKKEGKANNALIFCVCVCAAVRNRTPSCYQNNRNEVALVRRRRRKTHTRRTIEMKMFFRSIFAYHPIDSFFSSCDYSSIRHYLCLLLLLFSSILSSSSSSFVLFFVFASE